MGAPEPQVAAPENLSITLHMDAALQATLQRHLGVVAEAEACVIDSPEMAHLANTEMRGVIERKKAIERERKGFLEPAQQIIERAKALFNPAIGALERAEGIYKSKLLNFQQAEEHKAAEARRAAEAEARRIRQEAEQRAAAERARAEAAAREARQRAEAAAAEQRKQAEEAERLRREGSARAAAEAEAKARAAAAERAKQEERERAAVENGEAKAMQAQLTASAVVAAPQPVAPTQLAGFGTAKNWIAELAPGFDEEKAKAAIIMAIAGSVVIARPDLLSGIALDWKALGKLAKALEKNFNVPGMTARNAPIAKSRKG